MPNKKLSVFVIFGIFALLVLAVLVQLAHCKTTTPRPNSLGIEQPYTNPNTYLLAEPLEGTPMEDGKYIVIRFAPCYTYALYDESILFCDAGNTVQKFQGKSGVLILTYETQAHQMYRGLGCHELISVFEVK